MNRAFGIGSIKNKLLYIWPAVYPAKRIELGLRISGQEPGLGVRVVNGTLVFSKR